ncbi:hypothetical protein [Flavobacterium acetivorans]|uniref:hypothetical protein n=1 Tax=Flavobacterium acetivorans TaxID=2893883 RepID=UPI001E28A53E|nr:hypothetical protein [Flavobacterium sp. F-29]UFH36744.1 hypothetical protein LNP19_06795 [Flavobacterium sp. F-29]
MQKIILVTLLMLVAVATKLNAQESDSISKTSEWYYRGSKPASYEMGPEENTEFSGQTVLKIKSIESKINGFGNIMKTVNSDLYRGKNLKMTAYVKSDKVKSWAGLWMRVDYYTAAVLAFDNMQNRAIKGTKDWEKYEIVLFVPKEATSISYGVLLDGIGQIWFKDVKLEVVDDAVPETGSVKGRKNKVVSFEKRAKVIAEQIKTIKDNQKNALKAEIEVIDKEVTKGIISKEKAEELKLKKAEECAANIETKVAIEEGKLSQLIQDKVDGKFEEEEIVRGRTKVILGINNDSIGKYSRELNVTGLKFYNGQEDKQNRQAKRTTTQLVFATGLNNVVTNGTASKSDFKYWGSHFYEWGLTYNSRILKNNNLLHAKYGFSVVYNNLRPTANRSFVVNDNQTNLELNPIPQEDSRFKNVNLVFPLHLELDFTKPKVKDGKTYFKSHESFRLGLGGFVGTNLKSKQYIDYDIDGYKTKEITKGSFNVDNFIYGLSGYLGYGATSFYLKYDLNPLFKNNAVKQNNVSLGLRFDFN